MIAFQRLSLARQFLVASFPILLVGMLVIGFWVEREIERGVLIARRGQSLYVDSLVAPHLRTCSTRDPSTPRTGALDALFTDTPLGQKIVAFIIWRPTAHPVQHQAAV